MTAQLRLFFVLLSLVGGTQAQTFHVSVSGNDQTGNGSAANPWASISHAIDQVSDGNIIEVGAGLFNGRVRLDQQFDIPVTIRSALPYAAQLRHNAGAAVICFTCRGVILEGFDISHASNNNGGLVIQIQDLLGSSNGSNGGNDPVVSNIVIRNNVIHDSTDNDLLKVNNGAEDVLIEGNIFYNQAGSDEHIDINSTVGVTVQDNVFFNTTTQNQTSSFIVIKDSNGDDDTVLGTRNTTVRRNLFMNWQGSTGQSFIRVGEDGTSNFEADGVLIENNLFLGNSATMIRSALTIQGSRNVEFGYNTVSGNLPSRSYAARLIALGDNQPNEQVSLHNNIWSDPGGTMGAEGFIGSDVFEASSEGNAASVTLSNNLYYNGGSAIPTDVSQFINLSADSQAIIANPDLPLATGIVLPVWTGTQFAGGFDRVSSVFSHFVRTYGRPESSGGGINRGKRAGAPDTDILGNSRGGSPDLGAFERVDLEPEENNDSAFCFPILPGTTDASVTVCL
ncbi:MAG: hypothetical protein AAF353_00105 [Pseudomonadota bacterium]